MASSSGLTRRRGGAGPAAGFESEDGSRVSSPVPGNKRADENRGLETSYESGENGHKIAFDPRDISESAERLKQPKLTLMEEILLMGLKDKQVTLRPLAWSPLGPLLTLSLYRATSLFGTTTSHMLLEAVSSSNWLSADESACKRTPTEDASLWPTG
jgi:hypothetical protein